MTVQLLSFTTLTIKLMTLFFLQDPEGGGIADRPGDMVDVFHTLFGVAGKFFAS